MTNAEIYRWAAAEVLTNGDGCCFTIAAKWTAKPALHFLHFFNNEGQGFYWWPDFSDKSQNERCLLLCLAAAMADAGDL